MAPTDMSRGGQRRLSLIAGGGWHTVARRRCGALYWGVRRMLLSVLRWYRLYLYPPSADGGGGGGGGSGGTTFDAASHSNPNC